MLATEQPALHYITNADFLAMVVSLSEQVRGSAWSPEYIVGIGRGGLVPAVYVSHALNVPMLSIDHSSQVPDFADDLLLKVGKIAASGARVLLVDDINDSGGTLAHLRGVLARNDGIADRVRLAVLVDNARSQVRVDYAVEAIDRLVDKRWFVFPWEAVMSQQRLVEEAVAVPERLG